MTIIVDSDSAAIPNSIKVRQAVALPLYAIALILSFLSDAVANVAATIANDPH